MRAFGIVVMAALMIGGLQLPWTAGTDRDEALRLWAAHGAPAGGLPQAENAAALTLDNARAVSEGSGMDADQMMFWPRWS